VERAHRAAPRDRPVRVLLCRAALHDLRRPRPGREPGQHGPRDRHASLSADRHRRTAADGAAGRDLDGPDARVARAAAMEGPAPAGVRERGRGGGALRPAGQGRRAPAPGVRGCARGAAAFSCRRLRAGPARKAPDARPSPFTRDRPRCTLREASLLVGRAARRQDLRRDARRPDLPPRDARRKLPALRAPAGPVPHAGPDARRSAGAGRTPSRRRRRTPPTAS
jgi:hypothetical protein